MSQTISTSQVDESRFGLGGQSSHDADIQAAGAFSGLASWGPLPGSADEVVENSHAADVSAAYDTDKVVIDGTGLHR